MKPSSLHAPSKFWYLCLFACIFLFSSAVYAEDFSQRTVVDVSISQEADGSIQLSWNPVPNAAGYKVYHSPQANPANATDWSLVARVGSPGYNAMASSNHGFYRVTWYTLPPNAANFALVEGGTINNGTSELMVSTLHMSRHEVTQLEYQSVTGINPSYHPYNYGIGALFPVWNVSWFDAIVYCNLRSLQEGLTPCFSYANYGTNPASWPSDWTSEWGDQSLLHCNMDAGGYRLPTKVEWEFAARGGINTHNYLYSGSNNIDDVGWYWANWGYVFLAPHTVNGLDPNEIGIYDMSGNLYEWVWTNPDRNSTSSRIDPQESQLRLGYERYVMGGAWMSPVSDCTVNHGFWTNAGNGNSGIGFRVCLAP